jgi:hypothetical protein
VDLTSYAELAVRLVNADCSSGLASADSYRALTADRPHLTGPVTQADLAALRLLKADLTRIFSLAADGTERQAVDLLNALLIQHPIHPQVSGHDGQPWHLHLSDSGSTFDRYAAGAVFGLMATVSALGPGALRQCAACPCPVFFIDASQDRASRHCPGHRPARASVTAIRGRRRARQPRRAASTASA